ncbi:MAG: cysteine desulfurase NifS [Candidatus Aminicenantes bacterium 4484_214]|nr:MAG: cysteine desulfurase NifS [Candidatus Aminicenantes bacterium 4484_214]RLE09987.1 MAG: cysteine desulfurase NifS [Candidatus Aminicenantes bacterium]HDJ23595.1 aminotransferase class V-fold PLP-dependent enzyme [Candidatus Aminicenantes bacterium]
MVYLDNNATTPLDPAVQEKMSWFLKNHFGNPSSLYPIGHQVKNMITEVREIIANCLGAQRSEIIFTGSGTEADNFALRGVLDALSDKNEVITSTIEHPAIIETGHYLQEKGYKVTYVPVDEMGMIDLQTLEEAISPKTAIISIMHANNEIGTIQPIEDVVKIAKRHGILVHTDAVQSFGKIEVNVNKLGVDLLTVSAHKIYGPKGVGALYIRQGTPIKPLIYGGHQERLLRAGTENTIGIIGFGEAVRVLMEKQNEDKKRIEKLATKLMKGLEEKIPHLKFNGHPEKRIKGTLSVSFLGIEAEAILLALATKDVCVSTGSACSEDSEETSHVLQAIGLQPEVARSVIRMSLGRFTTEEDIEYVLEVLPEIADNLRRISSFEVEE